MGRRTMKDRLWLVLWGLASLIWLASPLLICEVWLSDDERLLSCRDALGMTVDVFIPVRPHPKWVFTFAMYVLWLGPPVAALLLMLAVRWIMHGLRRST